MPFSHFSVQPLTLDEAGYIVIEKTFQGRRPYTTMRLSPKGRKAFERYARTLHNIIDEGGDAVDEGS